LRAFFWKGKLIFGKGDQREKLRHLTSLADLPGDKILTSYIKQAVELNEAGVKTPRSKPKTKPKTRRAGLFSGRA